MKPDWKPVSKHMPVFAGRYMVTVQEMTGGPYVTEAVYHPADKNKESYMCGWFDLDDIRLPVIAWDEMPEPFTEDDQ